MGLVRRDDAAAAEPDAEGLDHQGMAIELIDAFAEHGARGLAVLSQEGRAEQLRVRQAVYDYVDRIWEDAKARRIEPAIRPGWSVVAGLRDLTNALLEQAMQAQAEAEAEAGDEQA